VTEPGGAEVTRLNELLTRQRQELDRMRSEAATRSLVDLARGMLMEQLGCSPAEAGRQLARLASESGDSVAELAAQITHQPPGVARPADGDQADRHRAFWIFGLMDGLLDGFLFVRALTGDSGEVTDFRIDHVSADFRDPVGRGRADLTGRRLLEMYPDAALAGGLFDRCVTALETGEPQHVAGDLVAAQTGGIPATPAPAGPHRTAL
jgi:hypothetical protein